jgi:Winged helix DNA-binding domain
MPPSEPNPGRENRRVADETLTRKQLNRATLARQLLLRRATVSPLDAVEHLVGLQAQVPLNPYTALWSRLERFEPSALADLLVERRVVRTVVMRATIHLVTADDCLLLRPLMQPVLDQELARHREYAPALDGVDLDAVLAFARSFLAEPRTGPELRAALAERFPEHVSAALAYACRNLLALVQVPPRGVWGRTSQVTSASAEAWLGRPLVERPSLDDVVVRYLAAFGPATVADVSAWSRLTGLCEVVERLRPRLRTFRDERGRELFDVPDARRPDPDVPAPPRFLPEYDNVLLSHADRSRFRNPAVSHPGGLGWGALLVDGLVSGFWRVERDRDRATLAVRHVERLSKRAADDVQAEGLALLGFLAPEADACEILLAPVH